jgi:hypothetical protein
MTAGLLFTSGGLESGVALPGFAAFVYLRFIVVFVNLTRWY